MGDASWSPLYGLYATSEDGIPSKSVSLHYRVNLQQETGEDRNDAKLILSTSATDVLDAGVPASESLVIEPEAKLPPPPPPPVKVRCCSVAKVTDTSYMAYLPQLAFAMTPLIISVPLMETTAIVSKNPMTVSYTVEEPTTIPSDHLSHKVLVAIFRSKW